MDNQTTGSADASANSGQPDYQSKYNGLMSAFGKRQNEWQQREAELSGQIEELTAKSAKLAEYEAREAAEAEEREAQAQYEQLRERFEAEPPAPQNPNASSYTGRQNDAVWQDRYGERKQPERESKQSGWPTD